MLEAHIKNRTKPDTFGLENLGAQEATDPIKENSIISKRKY
jgi:hypothetical protein